MERKATNGETGTKKWKTFGVWLLPLHTRETEAHGALAKDRKGSSCWDGETGQECSYWPVVRPRPLTLIGCCWHETHKRQPMGAAHGAPFPGDVPANSRTRKRGGWTSRDSQSAAAKAAGRPMARRLGEGRRDGGGACDRG